MKKIIEIDNLYKNYVIKKSIFDKSKNKTINALKDINLDVYENETIGLIGLNGAGKSTLIKTILGILKSDSGNIKVFDKDPFKHRIENLFNIGIIFGQKTQLRWDLSPFDSYKLNKAIYKIPDDKFHKLLKKYSEILELDSFINQPVRTLSLGQKMRADLVSSLLHSPDLLILDEATIGIDILSKNKIINLIKELKKETTIIYTSHNLNEIYEIADRIVILNKGKIVVDEKKENIIKDTEYLSLKLFLNKPLIYEKDKFDNIEIDKINEYEYLFKFISKNKLKDFLDYLYNENDINFFEIYENNLEKILKDIKDEHI